MPQRAARRAAVVPSDPTASATGRAVIGPTGSSHARAGATWSLPGWLGAIASFVVAHAVVAAPPTDALPSPAAVPAAIRVVPNVVADPFPRVARAYLVRVDGETVWASREAQRVAPASLTKLMTALLVAEAVGADDTTVVSAYAASAPGSSLGLRGGDRVRVRDLLAATLVASANDACRALAEWQGGTEREFVAQMNARAEALGLVDTHFDNACGFDTPTHRSTARDLAALTDAAMNLPTIARGVTRIDADFRTVDGRRRFRIANTNQLLGRYLGVRGVKTGTTDGAGRCLIALAERDGVRVQLVLLATTGDRWWTAHAMLDRAFAWAATQRLLRGTADMTRSIAGQ
jgi:D-alanyl-D-alanine carboxypeptidase (penicillin-binding protein 5/6)